MEESRTLSFRYHKSQSFRVIHADGAFGGLTPRRGIFLAFYNERFPIPEVTVQQVTAGGRLGDEVTSQRQAKEGIVREVEAGIVMDPEVAKSLVVWLNEKIIEADRIESELRASGLQQKE
jgi:hypothetical protein